MWHDVEEEGGKTGLPILQEGNRAEVNRSNEMGLPAFLF
jgi:hypothetical protein